MGRWKSLAIGIVGGMSLLALGLAVWFTVNSWWPIVVDIVLAIAAILTMLLTMALVAAVVYLILILREMKAEISPVLESLKTTTNTVKETAATAKTFGIAPSVRTASVLVGAGEVASVVLGRGKARKRAEQRQRRRHEIEREMAVRSEVDGRV